MTLSGTALQILAASKAGSLDDCEPALHCLQEIIAAGVEPAEIPAALAILGHARTVMYGERAQMILSLKELENSSLYNAGSEDAAASWEMAG